MRRAALALAASLLTSPAGAFDSHCYVFGNPDRPVAAYESPLNTVTCLDGPAATRSRWIGPSDEHRRLFLDALSAGGHALDTLDTVTLRVFTDGGSVAQPGGETYPTQAPAAFNAAEAVARRSYSVAELAQLPDLSYTLWDWAAGNEYCPLGEATTADLAGCHAFESHMGAVNANHFPPQSAAWYQAYHALAVGRARECRRLADDLGASRARFEAFTRECELEATSIEAVAHHFLEDAWSSGHMWERWGSTDLARFPDDAHGPPRLHALAVASTAGLIHGARGALQSHLPARIQVEDPLCLPRNPAADDPTGDLFRRSLSPPMFRLPGAPAAARGFGDLYLDACRDDPTFAAQMRELRACGASGVADVLEASRGASWSPPAGITRRELLACSPRECPCFSARATNEAMYLGAGVDLAFHASPGGRPVAFMHVPLDGYLASRGIFLLGAMASRTWPLSHFAMFQDSLRALANTLQLRAAVEPNATSLATGRVGAFAEVDINRAYLPAPGEPLAPYADPPLPWAVAWDLPASDPVHRASDRGLLLTRMFHRAHAREWCDVTTNERLSELRARATAGGPTPAASAARCEVCAEFAARHLRQGASAAAYDRAAEPLCKVLDPSAAVIYQPPSADAADVTALARAWCGCPEALVLTDEGLHRVSLQRGAAERLPIGAAGGAAVPVGPSPRALAITARGAPRAVIPNNDRTLSIVSLARGREAELDVDADPATTSAGAPPGVTRVPLSGAPSAVAVTPDGRYALVAVRTNDRLDVIDLDSYTACKSFNVGPDATEGNDAPAAVLVTRDGARAFVSLGGVAGTNPGRFVAVVDVARARDCARAGGEVTAHLVTRTRAGAVMYPGPMALSPDGARLAVAGTVSNTVAVFDARTLAQAPLPASGDLLTARAPTALAWWRDGSRLWSSATQGLFDGSLFVNGAVRFTAAANGAFTYDVGIAGAATALATSDDDRYAYVGSSGGTITALPVGLWDGAPAHLPAPRDGTGGCVDPATRRSVGCPATLVVSSGNRVRAILRP